MTKDNDAGKPAEAHKPADAAEPPAAIDLLPENVEIAAPAGELDPFQKEKLARHEAGHTLVADEVCCGVAWTNIRPISPGQPKDQKTHLSPSEAFLARDIAELNRDIVKIAVAGLVAEKDFDGAVGVVSEKLTVEIILGQEAAPEPDVAQVVKYCWEAELDIDDTVETTRKRCAESSPTGMTTSRQSSRSSWRTGTWNSRNSMASCSSGLWPRTTFTWIRTRTPTIGCRPFSTTFASILQNI